MNIAARAGQSILAIGLYLGASALLHAQAPDFSHNVKFQIGDTYFLSGDSITVDSIQGPADTIVPGNVYLVTGAYKLASHSSAELSSNVTSSTPNSNRLHSALQAPTSTTIRQGEGRFSVFLNMDASGFPHISFYPTGGGESFAGIYFGAGETLMKPTHHNSPAPQTADTASRDLSHTVHFELGDSYFLAGDSITIDSITGPTDTIVPGNVYLVKGTVKLASHPNAYLSSNVTSHTSSPAHFQPAHPGSTHVNINSGEAHFTVFLNMSVDGYPHISLYPSEGGNSFAGIYFGSGDQLMKPRTQASTTPPVNDSVTFRH